MTTMDKTYSPQDIEQKCYAEWEEKGYFRPSGEGKPFTIMLPPPNVTGSLHMGHGFGFTLMDVLIRYHRMLGDNTLWQPGTDHAGIATQMVVERRLNQEGKTRHDLGREKFVEKIWEWKQESGGNITRQLRRLGASLDWENERFTMDEDLSKAVRKVFIDLYEEGLVYRGKRLVNWDPVLLTAISDLEVLNEEEDGHMWHIRYPLAYGNGHMVVATTRPETMLGDVCVAVHPEDERYKDLVGQELTLPLTGRTIPIVADDYVDPEFGTGCVKITPAHDFNDYDVGKRHNFEPINIFTPTAHLNEETPEKYQGMERFEARKVIVADLEAAGLLEKVDKHKLKVPRGDRTGTVVEPYLTHQWYVKSKPLAAPAIEAVKSGQMKFVPSNWDKTYFQWMDNIEDWCISRQLWWGHRIPVWYDESGNAYVGEDEADARKRAGIADDIKLRQDSDVLDTWFSSALWPFSTLGWPEETERFNTLFPTSVLVTGFDIIFFWVARMMMMSLKFTGKIPFKEVYITGLIRDHEGHKMSKSKGNVLDPIDLIDGIDLESLVQKRTYGLMQPKKAAKIEKSTRKEFPEGIPSFGTDAMRFTFCSMATYTREIRFDVDRLAGNRNFCNKLWNASRYVMMNTEGQDTGIENKEMELSLADKWIISKFQQTITEAHSALKDFRFDLYAHALYQFTWNDFCDWYLELSKPILTGDGVSESIQRGTRHTLVTVLEALLKLLHPIMPFITEAIWQRVAPLAGISAESIMTQSFPEFDASKVDDKAVAELEWLKKIIVSIRTIRSEMNISPAKQVPIILRKGTKADKQNVEELKSLLTTLAKIENIEWLGDSENPPPSASAFVDELEIFIPMAGLIDVAAETARLEKEMSKVQKNLDVVTKKLGNPTFVDKAPAEVVAKEKALQQELTASLAKLNDQLAELKSIA